MKAYVLHENDLWTAPVLEALERRGVPCEAWHLQTGGIDLCKSPPPGVYYNRMSASSHSRGHRFAPEYCAAVLDWLEQNGRRVLNDGRALRLELSKVAQHRALRRAGVRVPRTVAAIDAESLRRAARTFPGPFVSKHNRAGRGLGVHLFEDAEAFDRYLDNDFEPSIDGVTLLQQYVRSPAQYITRCEMIAGELVYAVRVDTSDGFQLCPADACNVGKRQRFEIIQGFDHSLIERYARLMADSGIDVAAFEHVTDADGHTYTYDINTNTNYNRQAEARAGLSAFERLADLVASELERAGRQGGLRAVASGCG